MRSPFVFSEIEHWTGADLIETIQLLESDQDASDFMEAYTAACEDEIHAQQNLRYIFGLVSAEEAERLSELFMLDVPEPDETISPRQWWKDSSLGVKS